MPNQVVAIGRIFVSGGRWTNYCASEQVDAGGKAHGAGVFDLAFTPRTTFPDALAGAELFVSGSGIINASDYGYSDRSLVFVMGKTDSGIIRTFRVVTMTAYSSHPGVRVAYSEANTEFTYTLLGGIGAGFATVID